MPRRRDYENESLVVHWDSARCIHTGICLRSLPAVFDTQRRPWVDIDAADPDLVAETVERCPTGALRYERLDGRPGEQAPRPTLVVPIEDGPLLLVGDLQVEDPDGNLITREARLTLCRCGRTHSQPFCDNSHVRRGWQSGADNLATPDLPEPREGSTASPTRIVPLRDGSLELRGHLRLCDSSGRPVGDAGRMLLCRCGHSGNRPFCDSTHERVRFESREPATAADRLEAETPAAFTPNPRVPDPQEADR